MANESPSISPGELKSLALGTGALGLGLLQTPATGRETLAFSPISIACCLGMVSLGAGGETARQMAQALRLSPDPLETQAGFRRFMAYAEGLNGSPGSAAPGNLALRVANAVWGEQGYPFRRDYLDQVRTSFQAHVENLSFAARPEAALDTINRWVKEKTRGCIPTLVDRYLPLEAVRLLLTNAVYFKASWCEEFSENRTRPGPFLLEGGGTAEASFMFQNNIFGYRHDPDEDLKILEMLYSGNRMSLLVLLPGKPDGLPALEPRLTIERLNQWASSLEFQSVDVTFPKFKMDCKFYLRSLLEALGMEDAFDRDRADFRGITEAEKVWVSEVVHKVWMEVNEKGTEAAAATATAMRGGLATEPPPPWEFRADHPFLFCLRDRASGLVLFLGRVTRPQ